jgi:hypothetical protein
MATDAGKTKRSYPNLNSWLAEYVIAPSTLRLPIRPKPMLRRESQRVGRAKCVNNFAGAATGTADHVDQGWDHSHKPRGVQARQLSVAFQVVRFS